MAERRPTRELTVRVQKDVPGFPAGSTASLVVAEELPPPELTVMARTLAFSGDTLLLVDVRFGGRGWSLPGRHIERGEDARAAAMRETYD